VTDLGTEALDEPPVSRLPLTARLNTSAMDSRRGVVRLHPEALAALGIREWDAVSLTGSRTTSAVAGVAGPDTPAGTALLDDVTLSNAGLRENTIVLVAPVTVYGARSVTVHLVGDSSTGAARQGHDGRRHRVAAAA
jgi:transitional endoplasmic reticulum ATPase